MKKVLTILLFSILVSCNEKDKNLEVENSDIKEILETFMNFLTKHEKHKENFIVFPEFDEVYNDFFSGVVNDSIIDNDDVANVKEQYAKLVDGKIEVYVNDEWKRKLTYEEPENDEFYYVLSPPLFITKNNIIMYSKVIKRINKRCLMLHIVYEFNYVGEDCLVQGHKVLPHQMSVGTH